MFVDAGDETREFVMLKSEMKHTIDDAWRDETCLVRSFVEDAQAAAVPPYQLALAAVLVDEAAERTATNVHTNDRRIRAVT